MKARAPGKLVISGAYVVLEGAPAVATAVDRYALADTERAPVRFSQEVLAALIKEDAPFVDSSSLYDGERKLGLGSSAAVLVASLAAVQGKLRGHLDKDQLLADATRAHREAQGGGSGVDIATAVHGGTICFRRHGRDAARIVRRDLPPGLTVEVWASSIAASTPQMLTAVRAYAERDPKGYRAVMEALHRGAERAARALATQDGGELVQALGDQCDGLHQLGVLAQVPIVSDEVRQLHQLAQAEGACSLPAGAGGGDVAVWVGTCPSPAAFHRQAKASGYALLRLRVGAPGVTLLR